STATIGSFAKIKGGEHTCQLGVAYPSEDRTAVLTRRAGVYFCSGVDFISNFLQGSGVMRHSRYLLVLGVVAFGWGFLLPTVLRAEGAAKQTARRPNVLLIVADDLGYAELGCQGCKDIPTPNIDRLAQNGVRCTNGYVSCPVCSPTRAGLMTGR